MRSAYALAVNQRRGKANVVLAMSLVALFSLQCSSPAFNKGFFEQVGENRVKMEMTLHSAVSLDTSLSELLML
ncbi:hypothetical protein ACET3Z_010026 [Daucus carota]